MEVKTELPDDFEFLVFDTLKVLSGASSFKTAGVEADDIVSQLKSRNQIGVGNPDVEKVLSRMLKEGMIEEVFTGRFLAVDYDPQWGGI